MGFDWAVIAASVSAVAAVVALFLSGRQMRLSNKQSLFDRRISIWLTALGLLELYGNSKCQLKKRNEPQLALDLTFGWLTNNTFLCEIGSAAAHPLEPENQKPYLIKLEELKRIAHEARFAFKGAPSEAIGRFVDDYQELLSSIYRYQVLMSNVQESVNRFHWSLEQACKELGEPEQRKDLFAAFDAVATSYDDVSSEKMRRSIEKQIRLVS